MELGGQRPTRYTNRTGKDVAQVTETDGTVWIVWGMHASPLHVALNLRKPRNCATGMEDAAIDLAWSP
jgi:hypothetical protein